MKRRAVSLTPQAQKVTPIRVRLDEVYGGMLRAEERHMEGSIVLLASSIARHGLLQPIVVRRNAQMGRYALVCGARRVLACRTLGMKEIDALLIEADEQEAAACFMEEHMTRRTPSFLDEADMLTKADVRHVSACCALAPEQLERRAHMLTLSERVRQVIRRGGLTFSQAQPLLCIPREDRQLEAAVIIAERGLSAQQARRLTMGEPRTVAHRMDAQTVTSLSPARGRRRAMHAAMEAVSQTVDELTRRGISASVSMHAQERGVCIQILLKNSGNWKTMQEKDDSDAK